MTLSEGMPLGRIAALAVLVLFGVVLWLGPVSAYLDLIAAGAEQLEERAALLERYRALVAEPVRPEPGALAAMPAETGEAQAIATLQERIKSAAAASKVEVQSLQVLRSDAAAAAGRIGVRIRAIGDTTGLTRLLHAIEAARPVLYPDNLQVQARAGTPGDTPDPLDFQLDVAAFKTGTAL
jgi:general secretion pathway protein M